MYKRILNISMIKIDNISKPTLSTQVKCIVGFDILSIPSLYYPVHF